MATSASEEWGESAKSLCNYVNQREKTAVMKGLCRSLYVPATERQLSSQVIALLHDSENISVVIKICGQPTYSGIPRWTQCCHFASTVSCLLLNRILTETEKLGIGMYPRLKPSYWYLQSRSSPPQMSRLAEEDFLSLLPHKPFPRVLERSVRFCAAHSVPVCSASFCHQSGNFWEKR